MIDIKNIQQELRSLSSEGEAALRHIQSLSAQDIKAETPALLLRLSRLASSIRICRQKLQDLSESTSPDSPESLSILQLSAIASQELRWITELKESLADSRKSLQLSETMAQKAFEARLKASLKGDLSDES